jgi:hypothetical protein
MYGGVDFRKLELSITTLEPIIRQFRRLFKENPAWFEVPAFAIKTY